jgi:hypothetical protein
MFCESNATSSEHIWSAWMKPYFPKHPKDESLQAAYSMGETNLRPGPMKTFRGHPTSRKLKVVCKKCNNGWMSVLESGAKSLLLPMLLGQRIVLDDAAQRTMVQWITLKMMVLDYADPTAAVFTRAQTLAFSATREIPADVKIWLLRGGIAGYARSSRSFAALFPRHLFPFGVPDALKELPNTQALLLCVGKLVIWAVHSHLPELELGKSRQTFAKALWPRFRPTLAWPPMQTLPPDQINWLALTLHRFLQRPGNVPA